MALRKGAVAGMAGMAVAYGVQQKKRTEAACASDSYPPCGLSAGVKVEYFKKCKNLTFKFQRPFHNGFNWAVAMTSTSVPRKAQLSLLLTNQLNSQTSPT